MPFFPITAFVLSTEICGIVFLKFAMTLNIFTRWPRKKDTGDGFYYCFFHVWLQPVSAEGGARKQTSARAFFFSLSLIMGALKSTRSFFITAEARSSRWVSDG